MLTQSEKEILGDWSNIKGTHYHLVYALNLVLLKKVISVEFYKGNDLLALSQTASEPKAKDSSSTTRTNPELFDEDLWIQLKSTKSKLTLSAFLQDNLLANFIHNALDSKKLGRDWSVKLVTQGEIDQKAFIDFINAPASFLELSAKFNRIINSVLKSFEKSHKSDDLRSEVTEIAFNILRQISILEPVYLEVLKLEIHTKLTLAYPDSETVSQIENILIGAMIDDASDLTKRRVYNANWVNDITKRQVIRNDILDISTNAACDAAVNIATADFGRDLFVSRYLFENSFNRFLRSSETCFVLLGASGAGKSWVSANIAVNTLNNGRRLLIRGPEFDSTKTLESLITDQLKKFSSSNWPESIFLQKFAIPNNFDDPPPIVILDDLSPIDKDTDLYRLNLSRLVQSCKEQNIKLLLTCRYHVWNFLKLGEYISSTYIFPSNIEQNEKLAAIKPSDDISSSPKPTPSDYEKEKHERKHSLVLSDFSPEEMEEAVRRRISEPQVEPVLNQLRAAAFLVLRRPYFLARYFEKNTDELLRGRSIPTANIDELLDWTKQLAISKAAIELQMSDDDLSAALDILTKELWRVRPEGLKYSAAVEIIASEIRDRAADLIKIWRKRGFLSSSGNIQFAEQLLGDHIFAKFIEQKLDSDLNVLNTLNPQHDFGTVTAYLRSTSNSLEVAEKLIEHNDEWVSSVASGIAQTSTNDWRILAFLSALLTRYQYSDVAKEIYNALGQLAARSERAYKWVAEMYLGDRAETWRRGALALSITLEYEPRRVEKAVRTRLMRILEINRDFFNRDKRKGWILSNALYPLNKIKHPSASRVASRLINRYKSLMGSDNVSNRNRPWDFIRDADNVRGQIAVFSEDEFLTLLSDTVNDNPVIRFRAAEALIKLAILKPEASKKILLQRIESEDKSGVLNRLLIASYHLIKDYPTELLDTLSHSQIAKFNEGHRPTDGLVLELLGNLAESNYRKVAEVLPEDLSFIEPDLQALLGDMFVYAWWRVHDTSTTSLTIKPFEFFDHLDVSAVTEEFQAFAIRSRIVSLIARMCLDLDISASPLTGLQHFYPNLEKEFLYIDLGRFFKQNLSALSTHNFFALLKDLLIECVHKSDPVNIYPLAPVKEAVFRCANISLEMLTDIVEDISDPIPIIDALPHGWQAIMVLTDLLKQGKSDDKIISFAKQIISEQKTESTIQADAEGRKLLAQIGLLEGDVEKSLLEQRAASQRFSLFSDSSNAHSVAVFTNQNPDKFLEYLNTSIIDVDDVITLYELVDEAWNWQAVLISRVFARMLNERPITVSEAKDLCEQILLAARTMVASPVKDQYESVFQSIFNLLDEKTIYVPKLGALPSEVKNFIVESHFQCAEIFEMFINTAGSERTSQWFDDLLFSKKWWKESDRFMFQDHLLVHGHGLYGIYFLPAVRLSLVAVGARLGEADPAAKIMFQRKRIQELLKEGYDLLQWNDLTGHHAESITIALGQIEEAKQIAPRDERIEDLRGNILLRLNRLSEAENAFIESLSLPTSENSFRALTFYNLACVYAKQNRSEKCHEALIKSADLRPLNKKLMKKDSDLESVREEVWFQMFITEDN